MHTGRVLPGKTCKVNHSMIHFLLYCGQRYLNKIHASDFPDRVNLNKIHSVPPPKSAPCRAPPGGGHVTRIVAKVAPQGLFGGLWPSKKEAYAMQRNEPIDAETLLSTPLPLAVADSRPAARRAFLVGRCQQGRQKLAVSVALPAAGPGRRDLGPHHPATDCTVPLSGGHLRPHPGAFVPPDRGLRSQRLYFQTGSCAIGDGLELQIEKFLSHHPRNRAGGYRHLAEGPHCRPEQRRLRQRLPGYERAEILADRRGIGLLLVHHLRKQAHPTRSSRFPGPTA